MDDIRRLAESIRSELLAWQTTSEGRTYDAPAWLEQIQNQLDNIKANADDLERAASAVNQLEYTLLDLGPVSPSVAPSIAKLKILIHG